MKLSEQQLQTLSAFEEYFRTAIRARWARNPGRAGLRVIYDIYTSVTGDRRRFNDNCSSCILSLLHDCGELYYSDLEELKKREKERKAVAVSTEGKPVVKKARVKTTKKTR